VGQELLGLTDGRRAEEMWVDVGIDVMLEDRSRRGFGFDITLDERFRRGTSTSETADTTDTRFSALTEVVDAFGVVRASTRTACAVS